MNRSGVLFFLLLFCISPVVSRAAEVPVTVDPAVATALPAEPVAMLTRSVLVNGQPLDIMVDSLDNPLVWMQTTRGDLVLELFPAEAPQTVANFLGLASGTKPFIDPFTNTEV